MDFKLLGKQLQGLGRVYVQNRDAEAVTQHGKDSCDPSAFLLVEEKWLSFCCLCSNSRWSLRGTKTRRCKGAIFLEGDLQPLKLLAVVK